MANNLSRKFYGRTPLSNDTIATISEGAKIFEYFIRDMDRLGWSDSWGWGHQYRIFYNESGMGISIIKKHGSDGDEEDKWEVALLDRDSKLVYDSDYFRDVVGWLDEDGVIDACNRARTHDGSVSTEPDW